MNMYLQKSMVTIPAILSHNSTMSKKNHASPSEVCTNRKNSRRIIQLSMITFSPGFFGDQEIKHLGPPNCKNRSI